MKGARVKKGAVKLPFSGIWRFLKKHKVISILLVLLLLAVTAFLIVPRLMIRSSRMAAPERSYEFIRTVTLSKGELSEVVSTTGVVDSALTSTVTYSSAGAGTSTKVKTVNFAVGDAVEAGDVIVTLDTEGIQESIDEELEAVEKDKEDRAERITDAQESYNEAVETYNEAVSDLNEGQVTFQEAWEEYTNALYAYESAESDIEYYEEVYNDASDAEAELGLIYSEEKSRYDRYADAWEEAEAEAEEAKAALDAAEKSYREAMAVDLLDAEESYDTALDAFTEAESRYYNMTESDDYDEVYQEYRYAKATLKDAEEALEQAREMVDSLSTLEWDLEEAEDRLQDAEEDLAAMEYKWSRIEEDYASAKENYEAAQSRTKQAQEALSNAKKLCDYDTCKSDYESAEKEYESAENSLEQLESKVESAQKSKEQAYENYLDTCDSEVSTDRLDELYEQLENCNLKAETAGKITSLNVNVGDTPNGTIAVVEDTDSLIISITIPEADINRVERGMECAIYSDATDEEIYGTLTQIDPTTTQTGSFGAEVLVTTKNTNLKIGVNASVDIIISKTEDCFTVPMDAVGNDDDGLGDYVYLHTGGSGTEMTFEKVYITTGNANDYYVEISSEDLKEGDVIRASADLTQGLETVSAEEEAAAEGFDMGGIFGGGMPSGGMPSGGMPSGGMPSGGMPSGGMPSGGMPSGGMPSGGGMGGR